MSRIPNYPISIDDDDSVFSSTENLYRSVQTRHATTGAARGLPTTGTHPGSTRLSSSSSDRRDSLPPTRTGQLKPGDDPPKVDPLRLVKAESNPLASQARETIGVLQKQKEAQKEIKKSTTIEETDFDWEQNLSSWKDRRKSKPNYQPKALEMGEDQEESSSIGGGGKRSKTFKELMLEKEKRSDGHGLYTYESEDLPGLSRNTDAAPTSKTTTITVSATTVVAASTAGSHPASKDPDLGTTSSKSSSSTREFYFTSSLADLSGSDSKPSRSTSSNNLDYGSLLVQQKPHEMTIEFQTPTASVSAPETKVLIQKTAVTESKHSSDLDNDSKGKPWRSTDRQTSELTSRSTTGNSGVTLREKPAGNSRPTPPRPYSYAFTGHSDSLNTKTDATKTATRPYATSHVTGSTGVRGTPDRSYNPPAPLEGLSKDRRVKSNWELNFAQSLPGDKSSEFKPQPLRSSAAGTTASSSDKFKQALNLFQSKEGQPGVNPPTKAPLTTQRSVGRISRLPVEDSSSKPVKPVAVELRRSVAPSTAYTPSRETRSSYQSDTSRLRELSRSAHTLDTPRLETTTSKSVVPDHRSTVYDRNLKSKDEDDRYSVRRYDRIYETSRPSNTDGELSSSSSKDSLVNARLSGSEKEKSILEDPGKTTNLRANMDDTEPIWSELGVRLPVRLPKSSVELNKSTDQKDRIGLGSTVSWTLKLGNDTPVSKTQTDLSNTRLKSGDTPRKDISHIQRDVSRDSEVKVRDNRYGESTLPDWRTDQRRGSLNKSLTLDSGEPKSLYAFKYQTSNTEESIVDDKGQGRMRSNDLRTTNHDSGKYLERIPTQMEGVSSSKTTKPLGSNESSDREWYKLGDTGVMKTSTRELDKAHHQDISRPDVDSLHRPRPTQQASISDIFSKRSAAAIRGKSVTEDRDLHLPYTTSTSLHTTPGESRRQVETESVRYQATMTSEKKIDKQLKDDDQITKVEVSTTRKDITGYQDNAPEVKVTGRSYGVGDTSSRRHYGLQRSGFDSEESPEGKDKDSEMKERRQKESTEPVKKDAIPHFNLKQEAVIEVSFSSTGLEKRPSDDKVVGKFDEDMNRKSVAKRIDDSLLLLEPLEVKDDRNVKTSNESRDIFHEDHHDKSHSGKHEVLLIVDESRPQSRRHENSEVEESVKSLAFEMKLPELNSSTKQQQQQHHNNSVNLDRNSKEALTLSFTEAEIRVKQHTDAPEKIDFLPDLRSTSTTTPPSNTPPHKSRPRSPEESPPSPVRRSPSPLSPGPPPLPVGKPPPLTSAQSSSFEELVLVSPPIERTPSPGPRSVDPDREKETERLLDLRIPKVEETTIQMEVELPVADGNMNFVSVDRNSSLSSDRSSSSNTFSSTSNRQRHSPTLISSFDDLKMPEIQTISSSSQKDGQKTPNGISDSHEESVSRTTPHHHQSNTVTDILVPVNSDNGVSNGGSPPKRKPPELPKTKPKPKLAKSDDDWGFLSNTQLLDTSANRDKCRLTREGPMAVRKRPKSAFISSPDSSDLFDISSSDKDVVSVVSSSAGMNGFQKSDSSDNDLDLSSRRTKEEASAALRAKASLKGTRPLSYMGELNSSLAKKIKDNASVVVDPNDLKKPSVKDETAVQLDIIGHSETVHHQTPEAVDPHEEKVDRSKNVVKIPGLMNELNLSFKKKFQEDSKESSVKEVTTSEHLVLKREDDKVVVGASIQPPTANLLDFSASDDDDDDDEKDGDAPPPPLPNAPPPMPNWTSFPGDGSLPPTGPPPLPLIDFGDEDSGKIQFQMDTSGFSGATDLDQKWFTEEESGKTFPNTNSDISFA